ncbi:transcription elongation factor 1 homolog [Ixodes scapularis]
MGGLELGQAAFLQPFLRPSVHPSACPPSGSVSRQTRAARLVDRTVSSCAMGRRRSKRKPPPKRKNIEPLETQFNCPFCNHERSCEVKMDRQRNTGRITCRVCLEDFQTSINYLSEAIDVYSDWIDACEEANQ